MSQLSAGFWLLVTVVCAIFGVAAFLVALPGVSLACQECNCSYSLFSPLSRCRWPALWTYLSLILFLGAVIAAAICGAKIIRRNRASASGQVNRAHSASLHRRILSAMSEEIVLYRFRYRDERAKG